MCGGYQYFAGQCETLSYKMKNNMWFESPLPKRAQYKTQPDAYYAPIEIPSPTPPLSFRSPEPQSPWTQHVVPPMQQELTLPPMATTNDERIAFSDEEDNVTPVRTEKDLAEFLHTTGKKSEGQICRRSRPREKGLRKLSQRAFEIVREMNNVTYKDVAAQLVKELNEDEFDAENKEEQNIKRRVYDALNVLIALGVLKKDGRKIVSNKQESPSNGANSAAEKLKKLQKKLALKKQELQEKRARLRFEQAKMEKISLLVCRNRQNGPQSTQQRIMFPFIGVSCITDPQTNDCLYVEEQKCQLRVMETLQPFGDMDTLRYFTAEFKEKVSIGLKEEAQPVKQEQIVQFCSWQ